MAKEEKETPEKKKIPTAKKRMKQNVEQNLRNRSFKSRVRTAVRAFETAFSTKDKEQMQSALSSVYSLMDRGVKHGIYKKNKAARTKARMTAMQKSA
ncbi:MAG: 30S ribosomal protein S20 [Chlamydiae bacterium]|nr:30S ribosomal protein S20 [Chlamydiota bacterium]